MKFRTLSVAGPVVLLSGCVAVWWKNTDAPDPTPVEPIAEAQAISVPFYHPPDVSFGDAADYSPPDFSTYANLGERKKAFYKYLLPKVYKTNQEIMKERQWLLSLRDKVVDGQPLTGEELQGLSAFEDHYGSASEGVGVATRLGALLVKVDVVPASLVLAQAAKESGWGTSRFAREGNNFFGIWCFYEGCGITPMNRSTERSHEVAMFASVEEGIRYYMRTINTHEAYADLRNVRAEARRQKQSPGGEQLAVGLVRYSERGTEYVKEIQSMIRYNRLHRFTRRDEHGETPDPV